MSDIDYSPGTFNETVNTLASFRPAGLTHDNLDNRQVGEFHAERLLDAGYVIRYDPERAASILTNRKT